MWIEIAKLTNYRIEQLESRPARALWIEIFLVPGEEPGWKSRPARALWIEISLIAWNASLAVVEAREGLVD